MGIGVGTGAEGMGVDVAIASTSEKEFGQLHVKVISVEGGGAFTLIAGDCVRKERGIVVFTVVHKPLNSWVEPR